MREPRLSIAWLIVTAALGCDDSYPTPIRFNLDGGLDQRSTDGGPPTSAGASGGGGRSGQAGQTATPLDAAGAGAPASPFTCPDCAGLCVFGFCLAAPPPTAGTGSDPGAGGTAGEDEDDDADEASGDEQAECGDGDVEEDETCDPPSSCPASCDDDDSCTVDDSTGDRESCDFACAHTEITGCEDDDGCCPSDCDANQDSDCAPVCGNEALEEGETCDPPDSCPSGCDDGESCTVDSSMGSAAACTFACGHVAITACGATEGCCPGGCGPTTDTDCPGCGNGKVEESLGETCDPPGSCSCVDGDVCTRDLSTGSADSCNLACSHPVITTCTADDGCCAGGCGPTTDNDCPGCGNGKIELDLGETCDPPGTCTCDDGNACTTNVRVGTPSNCDVTCAFPPITICSNAADGCCPSGCSFDTDSDCDP